MLAGIRKYKQFDLVILIDRFAVLGGALKSIIAYYKFKNEEAEKVLLLDKSANYRVAKYLLVLSFSPRILVNSLSSFKSWLIIFFLLLRKDAVVYFHESETAVVDFKAKNPVKYFFLAAVLRRNKVLCISRLQQKYLQDVFRSRTELVYNYTPLAIKLPKKEGRKIILMAGYLTNRKGVSFYSSLADYVVKELSLPWDFYWAGSRATRETMYQSDNVTWLGDVELMDNLYPQIDAFFLSSKDEPFGLVCVEALKYYKHVVAYKNAGASELLIPIKGCEVYIDYELKAAVEALERAFAQPVDKTQVDYLISEVLSLGSIVKRIDGLFKTESHV